MRTFFYHHEEESTRNTKSDQKRTTIKGLTDNKVNSEIGFLQIQQQHVDVIIFIRKGYGKVEVIIFLRT